MRLTTNRVSKPIMSAELRHVVPETALHTHRRSILTFVSPNQVSRAIRAIKLTKATTLMIAPLWPGSSYYNDLAHLAAAPPVIIHPKQITPTHNTTGVSPRWAWVGLMLSGSRRKRMAYRRQAWTDGLIEHEVYTMQGGSFSANLSKKIQLYMTRYYAILRKTKF